MQWRTPATFGPTLRLRAMPRLAPLSLEAFNMARSSSGLQKSFVIHAVVYAIVVGGLVMLNHRVSPNSDWSLIAAWGWGVGLAAHGAVWMLYGRK
jgi:hypothetical protein